MAESILFCVKCKEYSMRNVCPKCGAKTILPKPPKYSPEDKYGDYRRQAKEELSKEEAKK